MPNSYQGHDSTVGFVAWGMHAFRYVPAFEFVLIVKAANDPASAESDCQPCMRPLVNGSKFAFAVITTLRRLGAVLYCKTNVPTAMMIAESYNNVWGRTLNPYNRSLSCGGEWLFHCEKANLLSEICLQEALAAKRL